MSDGTLNRVLTAIVLVVFVASLLATGYIAVNPPQSTDPYTEFYLLGSEGNASDYPTQLEPGESGTVTVGVTNYEGETTDYQIRIVDTNASGDGVLATRSPTITAGETWETNVTFSIDEPGRHRVRFLLYKSEISDEPDLTTRLWVNVTSEESTTVRVEDQDKNSTNMVRP